MKISIEHFEGKYPSFNVALASGEGREPFLVIKGCRIVNGSKGEFVSWPATKKEDGKYWNHCYASEGFATAVLDEARKTAPRRSAPSRTPIDDSSDIPFVSACDSFDMAPAGSRKMRRYHF